MPPKYEYTVFQKTSPLFTCITQKYQPNGMTISDHINDEMLKIEMFANNLSVSYSLLAAM